MKYSWEFKLECVEKYKQGKEVKSDLFPNVGKTADNIINREFSAILSLPD